ncbi:hypothetical protein TNCV_3596141 [Trichonephila clavipes]|nr:hypothetical protein TNCV_3596141 [Trichonephila clavipes]
MESLSPFFKEVKFVLKQLVEFVSEFRTFEPWLQWTKAMFEPVLNHLSYDHGSLVVKADDSWLESHKFKPNATEDKPCRGG